MHRQQFMPMLMFACKGGKAYYAKQDADKLSQFGDSSNTLSKLLDSTVDEKVGDKFKDKDTVKDKYKDK